MIDHKLAAAIAEVESLEASRMDAQKAKRKACEALDAATANQNAAAEAIKDLGGEISYWHLPNGQKVLDRKAIQHLEIKFRDYASSLRYSDTKKAQVLWNLYNAYWRLDLKVEAVIQARQKVSPLVAAYKVLASRCQKAKEELKDLHKQADEASQDGSAHGYTCT